MMAARHPRQKPLKMKREGMRACVRRRSVLQAQKNKKKKKRKKSAGCRAARRGGCGSGDGVDPWDGERGPSRLSVGRPRSLAGTGTGTGRLAGWEARAHGWIEAGARTCASQRAARDATPHVHPHTPAGRAAANQQADDRQPSRVRLCWVVVIPGSSSRPDRVAIGHNWARGSVDPQVQSGCLVRERRLWIE